MDNPTRNTFRLSNVARKIFIAPIRLYQLTLSPLLGTHCRHTPSCSQYTIEAIRAWGVPRGIWLGMKRIARCHPWGKHGYDPVPKKKGNTPRAKQYYTAICVFRRL